MKKATRQGELLLAALCLTAWLTGCAAPEEAAEPPGAEAVSDALTKSISTELGSHIGLPRAWNVTPEGCLWVYGQAKEDDSGQTYRIDCVSADGVRRKETTLTLPAASVPGQSMARDLGAVFYLPGEEAPCAILQEQPLAEENGLPTDGGVLTLCRPQQDGALGRQAQLPLPQTLQTDAGLTLASGIAFALEDDSFCIGVNTGPQAAAAQSETWLLRYTQDGRCLAALSLQAWVLQLQPFSADGAWFLQTTETGSVLCTVEKLNTDKPEVTRCSALALPVAAAFPCVGTPQPEKTPLVLTAEGVWQCGLKKQTAERVLRFADYPINLSSLQYLFAPDEKSMIAVLRSEADGTLRMLALNRSPADLSGGRTIITVACDYGPASIMEEDQPLRALAYDYNLAQSEVFIRVADYSGQAADEAGFASGQAMLERDILNNTAPDILLNSGSLDVSSLIPKGYFIDLYPYLDADEELSREDFLPNLLALTERNGTLPTVLTSFSVLLAAGDPAVVGDGVSISWAELEAVRAANPGAEVSYNMRRENVLFWQLQCGGFVDLQTGTSRLNTPEFVHVLQDCMAFSPQPEVQNADALHAKTLFKERAALLKLYRMGDFRDLLAVKYDLEDGYALKGLPVDSGSGVIVFGDEQWGITRYCQAPEAAWGFFRLLLQVPYQTNAVRGAFPTRRDALQAKAQAATERALSPYYNMPGELASAGLSEEELEFWYNGPTAQDTERLIDVIGQADTLYEWSDTVPDIVREELLAYENGVHTAEEAAGLMQQRVQTFLAEQG